MEEVVEVASDTVQYYSTLCDTVAIQKGYEMTPTATEFIAMQLKVMDGLNA